MIRRLAGLLAATVAAGALGTTGAYAAVAPGSWEAPSPGEALTGEVTLKFATNYSSVTFVLPSGNESATVSGGVATATWDTTKVANGSVAIGAQECDLTGCSTTDETVTVSNTAAATPVDSFAPAGGTVRAGQSITLTGYADELAYLSASVDGAAASEQPVSLPYTYVVPATETYGTHTLTLTDGSSHATATYTLVNPVPKVTATAPARWFPRRDGYLDNLDVTIHSPTPTDGTDVLTMQLFIKKGSKVVARGLRHWGGPGPDVVGGIGVRPGTYSWVVKVTDRFGLSWTSAAHKVVADPRRQVTKSATRTYSPASLPGENVSGKCGHVTKQGGALRLAATTGCSKTDDFAGVLFFPSVANVKPYSILTLTVYTTGHGAVVVFQGGSTTVLNGSALSDGPTADGVPVDYLSPKRHQLQFLVGVDGGESTTLSKVTISYDYLALVK